mmetsp:Transcript_69777/g.221005  ORF Transcript_69777/g.221005 Transcript_69777/m.221005 type:complete len:236 (+) Transcript_69777:308-1015(+)
MLPLPRRGARAVPATMSAARTSPLSQMLGPTLPFFDTTRGAAPLVPMACGRDILRSFEVSIMRPLRSTMRPKRSVPPSKGASKRTSTASLASPCTPTTVPRMPKGGLPPAVMHTHRSPRAKTPPASANCSPPGLTGGRRRAGATDSSSTRGMSAGGGGGAIDISRALMASAAATAAVTLTSGRLASGVDLIQSRTAVQMRRCSSPSLSGKHAGMAYLPSSLSPLMASHTHGCLRL